MLKKIWLFIWEGGPKGGLKSALLALLVFPVVGCGIWFCLRFDIPSPYAEILLFLSLLAPLLGLAMLENYLDRRKKSKLSRGPRMHYYYEQFAKHFSDQGVPEEIYYTVYRCLQEDIEDSHFKVMPEDALDLYDKMDAQSLLEFIKSEKLLKHHDLEMPEKDELKRAETVEQVIQLANRHLKIK